LSQVSEEIENGRDKETENNLFWVDIIGGIRLTTF
jgi:hypothetical protein